MLIPIRQGALILSALLFLTCSFEPTVQEPPEILLIVDGTEVQASTFKEKLKGIKQNLGEIPLLEKSTFQTLKKRVLQELIETTILLNQAQAAGITVSEQEISAMMETLHKGTDDRRRNGLIRNAYQTSAQWHSAIKQHLLLVKATDYLFPVPVSMPESVLQEYYDNNLSEFKRTPGIHLAQIVVANKKEADKLYKKLSINTDKFAALAREFSIAPEAEQGGDLGWVQKQQLPQSFAPAFRLRKGALSKPVHTSYGYHIFYVIDKPSGALQRTFVEVRPQIENKLRKQLREASYQEGLQRMIGEANIVVNQNVLDSIVQ